AAKVTHVPSMYLSEMPGRHHGCREAAIQGHRAIGQRCRDLDVDTLVVLDVHWLVNAGYHVNCNERFAGRYTSNELPHFIKDMDYAYRGD
ncbi:3,4-dihydroxyphenylacetate 2,3-dioxygenase, partial [Salmonella enterica]|nr:3,4-dihydroxyphenylacetate 2,3-dioxygenase [Salmonella enterica]